MTTLGPAVRVRPALVRALLLVVGLVIFARLIWQVGAAEILAHLRVPGWTLSLAVLPYLLVFVLDAVAWRYAFDRPIPVGLPRLVAAQIAGKAVNLVTPLVPVGGEPLKAYLLRGGGVPLSEGLASVVIWRTVATTAQGLFVLGVTGLAVVHLRPSAALVDTVLAILAIGVVLVSALVLAQTRGLFSGALRTIRWLTPGLRALEGGARDLDRRIRGYYRHQHARLGRALFYEVLSWCAEGLEVYVLLALLDLPRSPSAALAIAAFSSAVKAAAFAIPGSLGVLEGGNVAIFAGLGLPPDAAMAFSILRRLREVAWSALGFVVLSWLGTGTRVARVGIPAGAGSRGAA